MLPKSLILPFYGGRLCFKRVSNSVKALFLLAFLLFANSCREKTTAPDGYSDAFKPVFARVTALFASNRPEEGIHYLDSSMNYISKPNLDDKFRTYGFHYVYWEMTRHDNAKALLYADSMLMIANKSITRSQYVKNYVEANMALGDANFSMQKFKDAYQHYFEGLRVGKNNLNNGALSDYDYRMGMILYKMGHFKLAAFYFKDCYKLSSNTEDKFADFYRKQEVLDNIAISYKHDNELDSAIFYFDATLKFIERNAPQFNKRPNMIEVAKAVVYGNKAEVLIARHNNKEAIELLKKSIAVNLQKGNDNSDAELTEIKLAQIYYDEGQNANLLGLLTNLRTQLDSVKNEEAEADWNRLMSGHYLRQKNFEASLNYLQKYNTLKDSAEKRLALLKESNVNEQLSNFEKQAQINDLKNHAKLQQLYLWVAIICAIMAFSIIFLVYRNWKRSKKDIRIVNGLNREVNLQKANLEGALDELNIKGLEKDRILRTVAHDLRNPIGGIASLTLAMEDDDFTPDQKEMINLIKETSNNSLELINEILEITETGTEQLKKESVDINSLLSNSVELLRFKAAEKSQEITLELLDAPWELLISREKIWRVMGNLISNAIKFSPYGGLIQVKLLETDNNIVIAVSDSGIGIPENMKDKIFNMFTEAKRPGTAGEKSFGLGLSISKQIVENHGGQIWFENNEKKGATFYISLPKPKREKTKPAKNQRTTVRTP